MDHILFTFSFVFVIENKILDFLLISSLAFSESAHHETPVALGKYQSLPCSIGITKATCILCQEEQEISHNSRAMVLAGFVQRYKRDKDNLLNIMDIFVNLSL